jgi:3-oxoacyl-[acyl-carrier protein] reductase
VSQGAARPAALVTGASRGIGRAIALRLAARHDILAIARSAGDLDRLAAEVRDAGGACEPIVLDVSDGPAVARALDGRHVDVLVNNAGIGVMKPFLELTADDWHSTVATNIDSLFYVTRAVLPGMIERGSGHVVIIASIAGRTGFANGTCYAATKHAALGFAESLMLEVRQQGVKVSVVMPGSVDTDFSHSRSPATWKLSADEVAATVLHLVDTPADVLIHRVEIRPLAPPK